MGTRAIRKTAAHVLRRRNVLPQLADVQPVEIQREYPSRWPMTAAGTRKLARDRAALGIAYLRQCTGCGARCVLADRCDGCVKRESERKRARDTRRELRLLQPMSPVSGFECRALHCKMLVRACLGRQSNPGLTPCGQLDESGETRCAQGRAVLLQAIAGRLGNDEIAWLRNVLRAGANARQLAQHYRVPETVLEAIRTGDIGNGEFVVLRAALSRAHDEFDMRPAQELS
jgi:hypothetical protein